MLICFPKHVQLCVPCAYHGFESKIAWVPGLCWYVSQSMCKVESQWPSMTSFENLDYADLLPKAYASRHVFDLPGMSHVLHARMDRAWERGGMEGRWWEWAGRTFWKGMMAKTIRSIVLSCFESWIVVNSLNMNFFAAFLSGKCLCHFGVSNSLKLIAGINISELIFLAFMAVAFISELTCLVCPSMLLQSLVFKTWSWSLRQCLQGRGWWYGLGCLQHRFLECSCSMLRMPKSLTSPLASRISGWVAPSTIWGGFGAIYFRASRNDLNTNFWVHFLIQTFKWGQFFLLIPSCHKPNLKVGQSILEPKLTWNGTALTSGPDREVCQACSKGFFHGEACWAVCQSDSAGTKWKDEPSGHGEGLERADPS